MVMVIGNLRYSIQVISKSITKDEYGAEVITWVNSIKLRADYKHAGGDKTIEGKEIFNSKRIIFTTYYRGDITEDDRIIFRDNKYLIKSISQIGYKEGLQIDCELINS